MFYDWLYTKEEVNIVLKKVLLTINFPISNEQTFFCKTNGRSSAWFAFRVYAVYLLPQRLWLPGTHYPRRTTGNHRTRLLVQLNYTCA